MRAHFSPMHVVTLIHGTFSPNAAWTQPGSLLRDALSEHFGDGMLVHPFNWTGANNIYARIDAADGLLAHIEEVRLAHPEARQVLIAHSHGGNIALQAVSHLDDIAAVYGICCLATPFLHVRLRNGVDLSAKRLQSVVLAILAVPFAVATVLFAIPYYWMTAIIGAGMLLSAIVGGFLSGGVALRPAAENIVDWTHAQCPIANLKIIRSAGDEASLALGIGQLVTWASRRSVERLARSENADPHYLKPRFARVPAFLKRAGVILVAAAFGAFVLSLVAPAAAVSAFRWIAGAGACVIIAMLMTGTAIFDRYLFGLAALALILSTILNRMLIGPVIPDELFERTGVLGRLLAPIAATMLALMLDIRAEASPEGGWRVDMVEPIGNQPPNTLCHSIYDHPLAVQHVVAWLSDGR